MPYSSKLDDGFLGTTYSIKSFWLSVLGSFSLLSVLVVLPGNRVWSDSVLRGSNLKTVMEVDTNMYFICLGDGWLHLNIFVN